MRASDYNPASNHSRTYGPVTIGTPEWARVRAFLDVLKYNALCDNGAYEVVTVPMRSWNTSSSKSKRTKWGRAEDRIRSQR